MLVKKNILDENKGLKGTKCVTVCEIFKKLYLSGKGNNIVLCYTYRYGTDYMIFWGYVEGK